MYTHILYSTSQKGSALNTKSDSSTHTSRGVYSSQQLEICPQPPYCQLEKLPQTEHVKSSVVAAFLSMFKRSKSMAFYLSGALNQVLQM